VQKEVQKSMMSATYVPGMDDSGPWTAGVEEVSHGGVEKRNSLGGGGRVSAAAARFGGRKPINRMSINQDPAKRSSVASEHQVGVQLTDKPMDD